MKITIFIISVLGLTIKKLESTSKLMNFIELTHNGIIEYNSLIKKCGILVKDTERSFSIDCESSSVSGTYTLSRPICENNNKKQRFFFEREFTTNLSAMMKTYCNYRKIGEKSILVVSNPEIELDLQKMTFKSKKIPLETNISELKNVFKAYIVKCKSCFANFCFSICKDLETKRANGIFDLLNKGDYVLLFFNRDYNLIYETFTDLKRMFTQNYTDSEILDFLKYRVDEYLNNYKDPIWDKYFIDNGILDYETQEEYCIALLLTDLLNLLQLKINSNWIFKIKELNRNEEEVCIKKALKISVKTSNITNLSLDDFSVRTDKNLTVEPLNFKINAESLDLYFDLTRLIKDRNLHLKIFIKTSDDFYETDNILLRSLN